MLEDKEQDVIIEQLFREMYYQLVAYAQSALNDYGLAEEAVQDTFKIACAKPDDLIGSRNPKGWLFITLQNVIKNTNRSRTRLTNLIVLHYAFDEQLMGATNDEESLDLLYSNLANDDDFELIKRIALTKSTMLEASKELGISVEACKKRVQRAKKRLKKKIEKDL